MQIWGVDTNLSPHWSESIIFISIIMAVYYIYMLRILNLVWNHFYSWGTNFRAFCGSTDPWIKDSHTIFFYYFDIILYVGTIQNLQILEPTNVSFVSNPQLIWTPKLNFFPQQYSNRKLFIMKVCIYVHKKSEWVVQRQMSNFQLYHGENKLHFNEIMMMSALY
jgi:hypothetical protein